MLDPQFIVIMIIMSIGGLLIYFIPSIIAFCRKAKGKWKIFILNFFFCFSYFLDFLGLGTMLIYINSFLSYIFWFVGIVWACAAKKEEQK